MENLIYWSDNRTFYFCTVWSLFAFSFLLCSLPVWLSPESTSKGFRKAFASPSLLLLSFGLLLFSARWPGLFYPIGYNPDEDQLLAAARALTTDPIFFRSAETGSSGPANVYPLLLSTLFGKMPTLFTSRIIALAILWGSLAALYGTARQLFSELSARIAVFFVCSFFALTIHWDFLHYTSELTPSFLLSLGWFFGSLAASKNFSLHKKKLAACTAVAALSLVPFAKLQASLLSLLSALFIVGYTLFSFREPLPKKIVFLFCLILSGCAFPAGLIALFLWAGTGNYFFISYIQNALAYQSAGLGNTNAIEVFFRILQAPPPMQPTDFLFFFGSFCLLLLLCFPALFLFGKRWLLLSSPADYLKLTVSFFLLVTAFWTVVSPHRNYTHYLLFLPVPIGLMVAALISQFEKFPLRPLQKYGLFLASSAILFLPLLSHRFFVPNHWPGMAKAQSSNPPSKIASAILEADAGKNGRLCIWGYNPVYHTETGLLQATRLATSSALFNQNHLLPFFRKTYMEDLKKNSPSVFVDAVAPGQFLMMTERDVFGHEQLPELKGFVETNYSLFKEINGVRIYEKICN